VLTVEISNSAVELPFVVEPDVAVAKEQFAKICDSAVARLVDVVSAAHINSWFGLSATKALTGKFVSTLALFEPGQKFLKTGFFVELSTYSTPIRTPRAGTVPPLALPTSPTTPAANGITGVYWKIGSVLLLAISY
jgi:hypothetical protein